MFPLQLWGCSPWSLSFVTVLPIASIALFQSCNMSQLLISISLALCCSLASVSFHFCCALFRCDFRDQPKLESLPHCCSFLGASSSKLHGDAAENKTPKTSTLNARGASIGVYLDPRSHVRPKHCLKQILHRLEADKNRAKCQKTSLLARNQHDHASVHYCSFDII